MNITKSEEIVEAVSSSDVLELDSSKTKIRRKDLQ